MCNEIEGSYDKFIITIAPSYIRKNITRLLPSVLLLDYGDNYIVPYGCGCHITGIVPWKGQLRAIHFMGTQ